MANKLVTTGSAFVSGGSQTGSAVSVAASALPDFERAAVVDTVKPTLTASTPKDNATGVAVGGNIVLTFSEPVKAGKGNIVISNGVGDTRNISITDASQVSISGSTVTINPSANLNANSSYNVQMASGVIVDQAGNPYAGISKNTVLDFKTGAPDTTAPILTASTPKNNATAVAVGGNIVLTFSENVAVGSGHIVISDGAGDVRTIDVADASQVMVRGNTVTINPTQNLHSDSHYHVTIDTGAIKDTAGNAYASHKDTDALDFDTPDTIKPTLTASTPKDDVTAVPVGNNIVLTFSEPVKAGSGNIVISNGSNDVRTIAVTDASQITISGNTVTINPPASLDPNNIYSVQMAAGVIKDLAGNAYAGIGDATTLNFSTPDTIDPILKSSAPKDNATGFAVGGNIVLTFSEPVGPGVGSIKISDGKGDTRTIAVTDSSQVMFNGNTVTINPSANLKPNSSYNVQMADGVIIDKAGNGYAGINKNTVLDFKTGGPDTAAPKFSAGTPADNAVNVAPSGNIVLTFNENVAAGTGNIVLSNGAGDTRNIAIDDTLQVTLKGNTVTINPATDLKSSSNYSVQMAAGVIKDTAGNAYAGISDATVLDFTTADVVAPWLSSSAPKYNAAAVAVESNIVLTFNEAVKAGSGNIVISDGAGDIRTIAVTDASQVSFNGNTATLNPAKDLNPNSHYSVQMAAGVIKDLAGNAYAGIGNTSTLGFSTVDTLAPALTASTPKDNATAVATGSNLVLTFSEPVKAGSGNIVLSNGAGDTRTIAVTDTSQATFNGSTLTINPAKDLNANSGYSLQMAGGVIQDLAGNPYAGISNATTLNFSTVAVLVDAIPPTLAKSTPADNAGGVAVGSNLVLIFSETVKAGSGNIVISNGAGDTRTIAVADTSQVTFNGNMVTINPAKDLNAGSSYNVQMAAGVIKDQAGNAYAGIKDASTLNFSTAAPADTTAPTLAKSTPADNASVVAVSDNLVLAFSESVKAGSGNLVISDGAGDTRTIAVTDTSQISFNGATVTINPKQDLHTSTAYHVTLASGVIKDLAGNAYAGISSATTLNFTTAATEVKTVGGKVVDGYVAGATVTLTGPDGKVYTTTTDANGNFSFPPGTPEGAISAKGGTDLSTGKPFTGELKAPAGSTQINPMTTVQQAFVEKGYTPEEAAQKTTQAFGLSANIDLGSFDPLAVASDPNATPEEKAAAVQMQGQSAKVQNLLVAATATLEGASGGALDLESSLNALLDSLVENIEKSTANGGSGSVDLADTSLISNVLQDSVGNLQQSGAISGQAAQQLASTVDNMAGQFATTMADIAQNIDQALPQALEQISAGGTGTTDTAVLEVLTQIAQTQSVVQGDLAEQLQQAAETGDLSQVQQNFTGDALEQKTAQAEIGTIILDPNGSGETDTGNGGQTGTGGDTGIGEETGTSGETGTGEGTGTGGETGGGTGGESGGGGESSSGGGGGSSGGSGGSSGGSGGTSGGGGETPSGNGSLSSPATSESAYDDVINANQGTVTGAAVSFNAANGNDQYVIQLGTNNAITSGANIVVSGFAGGDKLVFAAAGGSTLASLSVIYTVSDDGSDISLVANGNGAVQHITLDNPTASLARNGAYASIDNLTELNAFLGGNALAIDTTLNGGLTTTGNGTLVSPSTTQTNGSDVLNATLGSVTGTAISYDAANGNDQYMITLGAGNAITSGANVRISHFSSGDKLVFDAVSGTSLASLDGIYAISDNGADISLVANNTGTVQQITLVGLSGSRAVVGGSVDSITELNTFLGGAIDII